MLAAARPSLLSLFVGLWGAFVYGGDANLALEGSSTQRGALLLNASPQETLDTAHFQTARVLALELGFDRENVFVNAFELWHYDFVGVREFPFVVWFDLSTRANLFNISDGRYQATLNTQTRFSPQAEIGFGPYITKWDRLTLYALPIVGSRYELVSNTYLIARAGLLLELGRVRIRSEVSRYLDQRNNRGYDFSFTNTLYLAFLPSDTHGLNLYARYNLYTTNDTLSYPVRELHIVSFGVSYRYFGF